MVETSLTHTRTPCTVHSLKHISTPHDQIEAIFCHETSEAFVLLHVALETFTTIGGGKAGIKNTASAMILVFL